MAREDDGPLRISDRDESGVHELVAHRADVADGGDELISRGDEAARSTGPADARRRPGEDEVTGPQLQHRGQVRDDLRNAEDHVRGVTLLHQLPAELALQ